MTQLNNSVWDTAHFGFRVYKTEIEPLSRVSDIVCLGKQEKTKLLLCRCDTNYTLQVHDLENSGFQLMGTIVKYSAAIDEMPVPVLSGSGLIIRSFQKPDIPAIADIAAASFRGYIDHFHADPRLEPEKCDDLYRQWAANSCTDRNLADTVLVAEIKPDLIGFLTVKLDKKGTGELVLSGVHPNYQGRGVYRSLIASGINWCKFNNCNRVESSTQINNYRVHQVWESFGLRLFDSFYTFHKWF